jgi:hypothetical protein
MRRFDLRLLFGVLLIVAGLLFLAQTLGILPGGMLLLWAIVFGLGGAAFVWLLASDRSQWWAVIPGFSLLGLAALMAIMSVVPGAGGTWGGALFLGAVGLSFVIVYVLRRDFWWAIIPAGAVLTLALIALSADFLGDVESGALLFLGLGLTFAVVGLVPTPRGHMRWAFIPAVILAGMGAITALALGSLLNYIWPLALIAVGLWILARSFVLKRG